MDIDYKIDPSTYPSVFYFFTTLLSEPPMLKNVSLLLVLFGFFQSWLVSFLPFAALSIDPNVNAQLKSILYLFIGFATKVEKFNIDSFNIHIMTLVFMIVATVTVVTWITYKRARILHHVLLKLRGLLFIFMPCIYYFPASIYIGHQITAYQRDDASFSKFAMILIELIMIASVTWFSFQFSPLIFQNPVFSRGHLPTTLFPNYSCIYHFLADIIYTIQIFNIPSQIVQTLVAVVYLIYAIQHTVRLYRLPYLSHFLTAVTIGIDLSHAVIPVCAIWLCNLQCQTTFFLISCVFLVLSTGLFYYLLEHRGKKIVEEYSMMDILKIDEDRAILYVQEALIQNKITRNLINQVEPIFEGSTKLEVLSIHQYLKCLFMVDDYATLQNLKRTILSLHMFKQLPTIQSYFLFELLHSVSKLETDTVLSTNNELMQLYQSYEIEAERFWDSMIRGKIKSAVSALMELNRQITAFSEVFRSYNCLYPNNDMVLKLKQDFADNVLPACTTINDTKTDLPLTQLQIRYAQFTNCRVDKFARSLFGEEAVDASVVKATQIEMNIKSNISKHVMKPISTKSKVLFFLEVLVLCTFIPVCSVYPFFALNRTSNIYKYINFADEIHRVSADWATISLTICQTINETVFNDLSPETLVQVIHNNRSALVSIQTLFVELNSTLTDFVNQMRLLFIQNSFFSLAPPLSEIRKLFMEDKIDYFPYDTNISIPDLDKSFQVKALLLFYYTYINSFIDELDPQNPFNSTLMDQFRERAQKFTNITVNLMTVISKSFDYLDIYVRDYLGSKSVNFKFIYLLVAIILITVFIDPFLLYAFKKSVLSDIRYNLIQYFRPHPQQNQNAPKEWNDEIEDFPIGALIPKVTNELYGMIIYAGVNLLVWSFTYNSYSSVSNLLDTVNTLHKIDSDSAISLNTALGGWLYDNENNSFVSNATLASNNLFNDVITYIKTVNLTSVPKGYSMNSISSGYLTLPSNADFHDFYHLTTIDQLYLAISYLIGGIAQNISQGLGIPYMHSFHIHFQTTKNISENLSDLFQTNLAEETTHLGFLCNLDIMIYLTALVVFFIIFWHRYLEADDLKAQLGRLIMDLDPVFIAQNQCLVEYIVGSKSGVLPWMKGSPIFEILNNTDTPIIIINDHLSIMAFTSVISEMFNYRPEQIIGQHYTMLFTIKGEAPSKSQESFFSRINDILSQKSGCTSKVLSGIRSDGNYLKVDVRASVITFDEHHYIFFELKSLEVSSYFEEVTTLCQNKIKEILETSIPLRLFPPIEAGKGYLSRRFFGGTLVFCAQENNDIMRPVNEFEEKLAIHITELFSGKDDALVLAATSSYALILYVNTDNSRLHRARALQFIKDYATRDTYGEGKQVSVMLDVDNYFETVQFLPPVVPDKFNGKEIPSKESNVFSPMMTTDPFVDRLGAMGSMLSILRPNMVIMQAYMAEHLEKSCKIMPVTLVNNNEKFVGITIDELPDASVMLEELKHDVQAA